MQNLKEKLKKMKGITLIALVITIVVLIILAGVAISFVMGRNGIIERSREGTAENTKQTAYEQLKLKILDCQVESYGERNEKPTLAYLAAYLKREEGGEIYSVTSESQPLAQIDETPYLNWSAIYTRLSAYPDYEFKINNTLQIAEVNGVKVADVGINTDDADATAEDILENKTAYVKGNKITGTMINRGELNWNPSTNTSTNIEPGYYTGGTLSTANAFATAVNEGGFEELLIIHKCSEGDANPVLINGDGSIMEYGTSSCFNYSWSERNNLWTVRTKKSGNYIYAFGVFNPSAQKRTLSANTSILNMNNGTLANSYGAFIAIKLK